MRLWGFLLCLITAAGAILLPRPPCRAAQKGSPDAIDAPANVQLIVRQRCLSYLTLLATDFLNQSFRPVLPDIHWSGVAGARAHISRIAVEALHIPPDTALTIEQGFFSFAAADVNASVTFYVRWHALGAAGRLDGSVALSGGRLTSLFQVKAEQGGHPEMLPLSADATFANVDVSVRSRHAYSNWVYQMLLRVFRPLLSSQIRSALQQAVQVDLPARINELLVTVPTDVDIEGLPFHFSFQYALYTQDWVQVPVDVLVSLPGDDGPIKCPMEALGVPDGEAIGGAGRMLTLQMEESVLQCVSWALYVGGELHMQLSDGDVPGLSLTTDLFGLLIPELPAVYPRREVRLDISATDVPRLQIVADPRGSAAAAAAAAWGRADPSATLRLCVEYRTDVIVLTGDSGEETCVAVLQAEACAVAAVGWTTGLVLEQNVTYTVLRSPYAVPVDAWNSMVGFILDLYGPEMSLKALVQQHVHLPVVAAARLSRAVLRGGPGHGWAALSADLHVAPAA